MTTTTSATTRSRRSLSEPAGSVDTTTTTTPSSPSPADLPPSSSPSFQELDPSDWAYLAEGKLHVLLSYHGNHPRFQNHVLRLLKERHPGEEKAHYDPTHERVYILQVVGPALGHQYLDGGVSLPVPPSFLAAISEEITPFRPARRAIYGLDLSACTVECLMDLTRFFPPSSLPPYSSPRLTLELKPKAGYTSHSRLVPPAHRFKYEESRFYLMQRYRYALHDTQALEPEWGKLIGSPNTEYSPLDLFSGERKRMTRALQGLLRNPQNFCQFFVKSQVVFGRGEGGDGRARKAARELLSGEEEKEREKEEEAGEQDGGEQQQQQKEEEEEDPLEVLMALVAQILEQEPLLRRLQKIQAMDVLDIEGAGLVMRRLIDLCGGQGGREGEGEKEALALLEVAELRGGLDCEEEGREEGAVSMSAMVQRLEELLVVVHPPKEESNGNSKVNANDDDEDEDKYEEENEEDEQDDDRHCQPHSLDAQHIQAIAAVQLLTKEECVVLLQRWLISLGACDCSIMLSLRRHDPAPSSLASSSSSSSSSGYCQTGTSPGLVYFHRQAHKNKKMNEENETNSLNKTININENKLNKTDESHNRIPVSYCMHVVDLGPKPPSKILSKAAMEKEIIEVAGRGGGREEGGGVCLWEEEVDEEEEEQHQRGQKNPTK